MPDMGSIAAALSSFNALKDIAKAMVSLHDAQSMKAKILEFNDALIDAQSKIFAVNEERSALIERVGDLEKEVANLKAWDAEKERYILKPIGGDTFAYTLKQGMENGEPAHSICANCYQHAKKSILQIVPKNTARAHLGFPKMYKCHECGAQFVAQ